MPFSPRTKLPDPRQPVEPGQSVAPSASHEIAPEQRSYSRRQTPSSATRTHALTVAGENTSAASASSSTAA